MGTGAILMDLKQNFPSITCSFDPCKGYSGKKGSACCPQEKCLEAQAINKWIISHAHPAFENMVTAAKAKPAAGREKVVLQERIVKPAAGRELNRRLVGFP